MRRLISTIGLVLACAIAAHAAPFTTDLQTLRTTLDSRRTALAGLTDKTSKARVRALNAAIKALDKSKSVSISGDVTTMASIAKGIEKAYAANDADLEAAFDSLLAGETALKTKALADIAEIADAAARTKMQTAVGKSDPSFATASAAPSATATIAARSKALKTGVKLLDAAALKILKAIFACGPGQTDLFHADLGGTSFDPPNIHATYITGTTTTGKKVVFGVSVSGSTMGAQTVDEQVRFDIKGLYAVGVFPVTLINTSGGPHAEGTYSKDVVFHTTAVTGTCTVAYYDKKKGVIGGYFDCMFTTRTFTVSPPDVVTHVKGKFRICSIKP